MLMTHAYTHAAHLTLHSTERNKTLVIAAAASLSDQTVIHYFFFLALPYAVVVTVTGALNSFNQLRQQKRKKKTHRVTHEQLAQWPQPMEGVSHTTATRKQQQQQQQKTDLTSSTEPPNPTFSFFLFKNIKYKRRTRGRRKFTYSNDCVCDQNERLSVWWCGAIWKRGIKPKKQQLVHPHFSMTD